VAERRAQAANPPDGLDAVDARQHHIHQHRVKTSLRDPLSSGLASPDELRLMAEFGEDRIEHDSAERIVLDAENAQRPRRIRRRIGFRARTGRFRSFGAGQGYHQCKRGSSAGPVRNDDIATHRARKLLD